MPMSAEPSERGAKGEGEDDDAAAEDNDDDDDDGNGDDEDEEADEAGAGDDDDSKILRALRSDSGGRCSSRFSTTAERMSNMLTDTPDGVSMGDGSGAEEEDDRALFSRRDTTVRLGLARAAAVVGAVLAVDGTASAATFVSILTISASAGCGVGAAVTAAASPLAVVSEEMAAEGVEFDTVAATAGAGVGAGADGSRSALVMPILI